MYTLDPSVPEVLEVIKKDVRCFREWGYQLLKHDFSTFDLFGKWGFEPGFRTPDVHFADRTKTTAEIIKNSMPPSAKQRATRSSSSAATP